MVTRGKLSQWLYRAKEFTRAQHRSHTRCVCECQLFLGSVLCDGISCLDQRMNFTLSSTPSKILLSEFWRNKNSAPFSRQYSVILSWKVFFYRIRGLVNNINLKHSDRKPVAGGKMTLGQVVPNFTRQVVSSKTLRICRWKLWVNCMTLSKWPQDTKKTCRNKFTLSSCNLMFRLKEKFSVFRHFFDQWNFSIEDCTFLYCSALE